jgi:polar amino acid transport system permease protein
MIEFTFWDILRNLLLAARWTVLLSWPPSSRWRGRHGRAAPDRQEEWARRCLATSPVQGTPLLMQLFLMFSA